MMHRRDFITLLHYCDTGLVGSRTTCSSADSQLGCSLWLMTYVRPEMAASQPHLACCSVYAHFLSASLCQERRAANEKRKDGQRYLRAGGVYILDNVPQHGRSGSVGAVTRNRSVVAPRSAAPSQSTGNLPRNCGQPTMGLPAVPLITRSAVCRVRDFAISCCKCP